MNQALAFGLLVVVVMAVILVPIMRRRTTRPAPGALQAKAVPPPPAAARVESGKPSLSAKGRIQGQVRDASVKAVGDIVNKHPGEAASVLRRWIRSDNSES